MKYTFLKLLCFLSLLASFYSCRVLKEPEYRSIENLSLENFGASGSILSLDMKFFNPNNSRFKLKKVEADAYLNDSFLGHFRVDSLLRVKRKNEFVLPVKLPIDLKSMLNYSLMVLQYNSVIIKVKGKAKLGKWFIYVKYPISYESSHTIPDFLN